MTPRAPRFAPKQRTRIRRPDPPKPERNAPCSCGSGKKYKKCHLLIEREEARLAEEQFQQRLAARRERELAAIIERHGSLDENVLRKERARRALLTLASFGCLAGR